jgi:hypothetical protein
MRGRRKERSIDSASLVRLGWRVLDYYLCVTIAFYDAIARRYVIRCYVVMLHSMRLMGERVGMIVDN